MSLQVWLPLNGSLEQYGLKNLKVEQINNTIRIPVLENTFYNGDWSISFKISSIENQTIFQDNLIKLVIEINSGELKINGSTTSISVLTNDLIIITKHGNVVKLYKNNIDNEINLDTPVADNYILITNIIDFKIYNHCLSKMEIALILPSEEITESFYIDKDGNLYTFGQFYEI